MDQPQKEEIKAKDAINSSEGEVGKKEARTKYARLLKMEEAKQALNKEMDKRKP